MIALFKLSFSLILPWLVGYALLSLCYKKETTSPALERLALAWVLGTGAFTLMMFFFVITKIPLTIMNITFSWSIFLVIALPIIVKNGYPVVNVPNLAKTLRKIFSPPSTKNTINYWLERLLLLAIAGKVGYIFFESLIKPVVSWDAWANWSLKAKIFFMDPLPLVSYYESYRAGIADYPLHLPLLEAWVYLCLGAWNDQLVKIIFPLYFVSLLLIFYYLLRRSAPRLNSLLFTFLLSALPFLVYHATIEYADFPLTVYYSVSLFLLYLWAEKAEPGNFFCSAIVAGFLPLIKKEGLVYLLMIFVIFMVVLLTKRSANAEKARLFIRFTVFPIIIGAPWLIFSQIMRLKGVGEQAPHLMPLNILLDRILNIFITFFNKMFLSGNWNIMWLLFCLAIILYHNFVLASKLKLILFSIVLNLAFLIAIYLFTESYAFLLDGTTLNRNMLIIMPAVVFLIASVCLVKPGGKRV